MLPFFHRQVSRRALGQAGFSEAKVRLVSETSRWPDWYRWTDLAAHASTPTDETGVPKNPAVAAESAAALLRDYLQRLTGSSGSEQLVWLGFALHLVQDLASHQGRTNPEHAFQVFLLFPNPDYHPVGLSRGLRYSRRLLDNVERQLGQTRYYQLRRHEPSQLPNPAEAEALLGRRNFSLGALASVLGTARHYLRVPKQTRRVRWDLEHVLTVGLQR